MSDVTKHRQNQARLDAMALNNGLKDLLIELMDRLDSVERQLTVTQNYNEGTWRELYTLKEHLREVNEQMRNALTDS